MIMAAQKLDIKEKAKVVKEPVLVSHLFDLLEHLTNGESENLVAYTVALVAFWGMARLGELLKAPNVRNQVQVKDVIWDPAGEFATIRIREAKTASVGEIQEIYLRRQSSLLNPAAAVRRLIDSTKATEDDMLFSYPSSNGRKILTKSRCQTLFAGVWNSTTNKKLTSHSFRVGGASLRWNLKVPLEDIVAIGRWKSKSYKLYIREYSDEAMLETERILRHVQL
jgi:hypothetical protein